jgi:hypothetical protein
VKPAAFRERALALLGFELRGEVVILGPVEVHAEHLDERIAFLDSFSDVDMDSLDDAIETWSKAGLARGRPAPMPHRGR